MTTQNWETPGPSDELGTVVLTHLVDRTASLRANHEGATEPTNKVAYMLWADTTAGLMKLRNAANDGWIALWPLAAQVQQVVAIANAVAMAAKELQVAVPQNATVLRAVLVPDTASTGSVASTTEWTFALENVTQAEQLFSATPSTATVVSGVGGGELAADTVYTLNANQNADVDADDVLRFTIASNGSPTAIADVSIALVLVPRGV